MLADYNPNIPPIEIPTQIPPGHLWQVMDWFADLLVSNATGTYAVHGLSPVAISTVRNNCLQAAALIRKAADILRQNGDKISGQPQQASHLSRFLSRTISLTTNLLVGAGTAALAIRVLH